MDNLLDFLRGHGLLDKTAVFSATPLKGGYWNDVYRIQGEGVDWVAKMFRAGWELTLYPIMPDAEAAALRVLQGTAVAPDPIAYFPASNGQPAVLIYEFWPGRMWHSGVAAVAAVLRRLHGLDASGLTQFRQQPTSAAGILAQGDELLAAIPDSTQGQQVRQLRPPVRPLPQAKRPSLLHTDFGPGNMIDGPRGLRIIDWQCPGLGDPTEDVWSFLSPGLNILFHHEPLTATERADFLRAYGDVGVNGRLPLLTPYYSYRFAAYCCLRIANAPEAEVQAVYRRALAAELGLGELEIGD
jgi:aminoglycoside phosphotransferase (APT) family kinase protein